MFLRVRGEWGKRVGKNRLLQGQERLATRSPRHPCLAPARGFRSRPTRARRLSPRRRGPAPERPEKTAAIPAHRFLAPRLPVRSFFGLQLRKLFAKIRCLLPNVQPIKKSVRRFEPNAEPSGDLRLFGAFLRFNFVVARNHFRAALAEPGYVQNTLYGRVLALRAKLAHQLIQPHDADLGSLQRLEVQQVLELLFVLFLGFFLLVDEDFLSRVLQHVRDVFCPHLAGFAMFREEPPPQLVDLRRRPLLDLDLPGCLQDQGFLRFQIIRHRALPRCCLVCFFLGLGGAGGGGGGSAGKPASNRRYFTTFLLCSARVAPKKCPPCVLATK